MTGVPVSVLRRQRLSPRGAAVADQLFAAFERGEHDKLEPIFREYAGLHAPAERPLLRDVIASLLVLAGAPTSQVNSWLRA